MKTLGNILWIIFGGLESAIGWLFAGIILCITIVGIPFGLQCFKMASLVLTPFGKVVDSNFSAHPIVNFIFAILCGIWMAIGNAICGVIYCITIIGIPFGLQWFKLAKLSVFPFGATVKK